MRTPFDALGRSPAASAPAPENGPADEDGATEGDDQADQASVNERDEPDGEREHDSDKGTVDGRHDANGQRQCACGRNDEISQAGRPHY